MENKAEKKVPVSTGKKTGRHWPRVHPLMEAERLFDRLARHDWPLLSHWPDLPWPSQMREEWEVRMPNLDVVNRENDILVRAELPGVEKKDLDISLTDNLLTLKADIRKETKGEQGDYFHREISQCSFARSITLPSEVNGAKAKAAMKDGVLEITIPKVESSKRNKIAVE